MNHTNLNALSDDHPARSHPDWVAAYGKQLYYNPGIPEVRQFITDGIKEVVSRYDIDAVHMDDYFYPYKIAGQEFPDQAEYERYGKAHFASIDDWRRDNVNQLVKEINQTIKREKPYVKPESARSAYGEMPQMTRQAPKRPPGCGTTMTYMLIQENGSKRIH